MKRWVGTVTAVGVMMAQSVPTSARPAQDTATPAAQSRPAEDPGTQNGTDDADGETVAVDVLTAVPDPAKVAMPDLAFTETPEVAAGYPKYYYFHRVDVGFEEALADIRECDGFARGLAMSSNYNTPVYSPYGGVLGNAVGGAIAGALAVAIFGSAELRKARRVNMRRCMHYKGYQRFGLEKERWQTFNFEEGLSSVKETDRQRMLAQQAKVAASALPVQKDLGL